LTNGLNFLLKPVRDHFTNDAKAKDLLVQMAKFKEEIAAEKAAGGVAGKKKIRPRANLCAAGLALVGSGFTVAPLPSSKPTLVDAVGVIQRLRRASAASGNGKVVLLLPDWTARARNCVGVDPKCINAYYDVLLSSIKSLDPELMKDNKGEEEFASVTVLRQSDAILSDPSNYWITVIDAGRAFRLDDVAGKGACDSDGVGMVIGRLMGVADTFGLRPSKVCLAEVDVGLDGVHEDKGLEARLLQDFYKLERKVSTGIMEGGSDDDVVGGDNDNSPDVEVVSSPDLNLQRRTSEAHRTENDEYYLLDDPKVHGKSKMKKSFCEPGNVEYCPPMTLAWILHEFVAEKSMAAEGETTTVGVGGEGNIVVKRSVDNGGDVVYHQKGPMVVDFAEGSLHPGDLKATAAAIAVKILEKVSSGIKADPNAAKAAKVLKAFEKKMAKNKKNK